MMNKDLEFRLLIFGKHAVEQNEKKREETGKAGRDGLVSSMN